MAMERFKTQLRHSTKIVLDARIMPITKYYSKLLKDNGFCTINPTNNELCSIA